MTIISITITSTVAVIIAITFQLRHLGESEAAYPLRALPHLRIPYHTGSRHAKRSGRAVAYPCRCFEHKGANLDPQIVGPSLSGHPHKEDPQFMEAAASPRLRP